MLLGAPNRPIVRRRPLFILPSGQGRSSLAGRSRSTAPSVLTSDGHSESAERLTSQTAQRSNIINQILNWYDIHSTVRSLASEEAQRQG